MAKKQAKPRAHAQPETTKTPSTLQLTATAVIEAASAAEEGATPRLPRFRMVAYTGAPMRIVGWRYPGDLGGACTEAWHTVKLWRRFDADVHLIPTWGSLDGK